MVGVGGCLPGGQGPSDEPLQVPWPGRNGWPSHFGGRETVVRYTKQGQVGTKGANSEKGAASGRASAKVRGLRTLTTQKSTVQGARSGARAGQGLAKPLVGAAS
jgi:hypothetical protein